VREYGEENFLLLSLSNKAARFFHPVNWRGRFQRPAHSRSTGK
jgi:hypothetical protein